MPSIFDHQARCTFRCKRTYTQFAVQLHSCVPMRQRTRRKASHLFTSLPNSINLVPTRAARTRCVQDLHAWISHLSHEQVHDSASVSVDFCQAQVEKEKKNTKLHPQEEVGSNSSSPQSKGKRGRNISET